MSRKHKRKTGLTSSILWNEINLIDLKVYKIDMADNFNKLKIFSMIWDLNIFLV